MDIKDFGNYSEIATAATAFLALFGAILQIVIGKHEARKALANSIYKDYLLLAFENPQFSAASYPKSNPKIKQFSSDDDTYEKYEFFVAHMLFAAELILERTKGDGEWRETLIDQFRYHSLYLSSQDFPENHYADDMKKLIEEAISRYDQE
jgi:hypothetical protein